MSVLNVKDATTRLETMRPYLYTDPFYYSVLNRPLEDLHQRTVDLNNIFRPARWFYVHGPLACSVYVDPGWSAPDPVASPVYFAGDVLTISPALPGKIRIDLVYFDLANSVVGISQGLETLSSVSFMTLFNTKTDIGAVPGGAAMLPLAYLFVDESATRIYSVLLPSNTAGYIRDCRLSPGAGSVLFEDTVSNIKKDTAGGSVGSTTRVPRAGHQHPINYSTAAPSTMEIRSVGSVGVSGAYAMVDHVHGISMLNNPALLKPSDGAASIGDGGDVTFVRGDHTHPAVYGLTTPARTEYGLAADPGSSVPPILLSRLDHAHEILATNIRMRARYFAYSWWPSSAAWGTGALPFDPLLVLAISYSDYGGWTSCSFGFTAYPAGGVTYSAAGAGGSYHGDDGNWAATGDVDDVAGDQGSGLYRTAFSRWLEITKWSKADGVEFTPTSSLYILLKILVIGTD